MRVLLDANVPRRLQRHVVGHDVSTAREMGWNALPDGALLAMIDGQLDCLVTMDKSLPFQQRIEGRSFGVIILRAKSNRIGDLLPLVPALLEALEGIAPGEAREVG